MSSNLHTPNFLLLFLQLTSFLRPTCCLIRTIEWMCVKVLKLCACVRACSCLNWTLNVFFLRKAFFVFFIHAFIWLNVNMYSHFHPFIDLFARSFIHLVSHSSAHTRSLDHSLIYPCTHSVALSVAHSFIILFIPSTDRSVYSSSRFKYTFIK